MVMETKFTTVRLMLKRLARFFFYSYDIVKIEFTIYVTSDKDSCIEYIIS